MKDKNGNRIPVRSCLSTSDNKFDPFTEFDDWFDFDTQKGYNSLQEVARVDKSSNNWPYEDQLLAYEDAVDFCVWMNLTGNRIKVTRPQ
jgi:hypothetical protein